MRDPNYETMSLEEKPSSKLLPDATVRADPEERSSSFSFLGGFGLGNFGNEITLKVFLSRLRRLPSNVKVTCICTGPGDTVLTHNIPSVPISPTAINAWRPKTRFARVFRAAIFGIPNELHRWLRALTALKGTEALIVPGTGLLTDAYGLTNWGPYALFRWSLSAKIRGSKIFFVSVGAGPIDSRVGRWLVRSALAFADFRSYRDDATKKYLSSIGAGAPGDRVFPDLAFSVIDEIAPKNRTSKRRRPVIGLGLMLYHAKLSSDSGCESTYSAYLEQLAAFAKWLLAREYDVRLLIGELSDIAVVDEFKELLRNRLAAYDEERILDEPVRSVEDLLAQLAETDAVVATRFHNILLALALNKPVISISFHQKCTSLMESMGLLEYCQDIKELDAERLIGQFLQLEKNADGLRRDIRKRVEECRKALDEQYSLIFKDLLAG